jgi:hypothetical protein
MDVSLWQEQPDPVAALEQQQSPDPELEAFRRQLEGLL